MKLLTLNIWGGIVYRPLIKFIKQQGKAVDIFCFQEVFNTTGSKKTSGQARANLFQEFKKVLPNYHGFFAPVISGYDLDGRPLAGLSFGLAIKG